MSEPIRSAGTIALYDPECWAAVADLPPLPPLTAASIPFLRSADFIPRPTNGELERDGAYGIQDRTAPGPDGAPGVPLIVCVPVGATAPSPVLYYVHGGGMVSGTNRDSLGAVLDLAATSNAAVVSVDYRLAPESPHPGPVEDCYAGLCWLADNAGELGLDPSGLVLVGGSAGGGIAAALALLARDRGGPQLAGQLLMCPMLDDRNDTPSAHQMSELPMWNQAANEVGWTALLGDTRGTPDVSAYAAPARATDLSGLPPAFIDVGSADTFRDEDVCYASAIWLAGGSAELHVWPGGFHGFDGIAPRAALSQAAAAARVDWLRRVLGSSS